VEDGEDSAAPFEIYTWKIAEKFITYYWPQVRPYAGKVLRQNTGNSVRRWTNTFQFSAKCRKHAVCIASAKSY
jgi:hypothetical protein